MRPDKLLKMAKETKAPKALPGGEFRSELKVVHFNLVAHIASSIDGSP